MSKYFLIAAGVIFCLLALLHIHQTPSEARSQRWRSKAVAGGAAVDSSLRPEFQRAACNAPDGIVDSAAMAAAAMKNREKIVFMECDFIMR